MKRRDAIALISAAAAGTLLFQRCQFTSVPKFKNFELKSNAYKQLQEISNTILPIPVEQQIENYSPSDFTLTMVDDIYSAERRKTFLSGMEKFQEYTKNNAPDGITAELISGLMDNSSEMPEISQFLSDVKGNSVLYYTNTEKYLTSYTDYNFVPVKYTGCVSI